MVCEHVHCMVVALQCTSPTMYLTVPSPAPLHVYYLRWCVLYLVVQVGCTYYLTSVVLYATAPGVRTLHYRGVYLVEQYLVTLPVDALHHSSCGVICRVRCGGGYTS